MATGRVRGLCQIYVFCNTLVRHAETHTCGIDLATLSHADTPFKQRWRRNVASSPPSTVSGTQHEKSKSFEDSPKKQKAQSIFEKA